MLTVGTRECAGSGSFGLGPKPGAYSSPVAVAAKRRSPRKASATTVRMGPPRHQMFMPARRGRRPGSAPWCRQAVLRARDRRAGVLACSADLLECQIASDLASFVLDFDSMKLSGALPS